MTADVYQGRCVGGPLDGQWRKKSTPDFAFHPDVDVPRLGTYSWFKGQWHWMPEEN